MKEFNLKIINENIKKVKVNILDAAYAAGSSSSHIGGALSLVDILTVLFCGVINYSKDNFKDDLRDRFILSKGHGCLVYYSILCNLGIISKEQLLQFEKNDSFLGGHPIKNLQYGLEFSTGSLGMGMSLGIGVCLALKKKNNNSKVYVVLGDGECNEGSVWEAAMAAPHYELNNLTVILDNNQYQQTGLNKEIMNTYNLTNKFKSFNWDVINIDGHNLKEIFKVLAIDNKESKLPKMIICNTIKGKGISFCENNNQWHHSILSKALYDKAISEII